MTAVRPMLAWDAARDAQTAILLEYLNGDRA